MMLFISIVLNSALVAPPCHQLHITRISHRLPRPRAAASLPMEPERLSPAEPATDLLPIEPEPQPPAVPLSGVQRFRGGSKSFVWTPLIVGKVAFLFLLSGVTEIGGGWLIWQAMREGRPRWWAAVGSAVLVAYGFVPTLQPLNDFGRLYAVYGGIFIALSYAWGWRFDGVKPDLGDIVGSVVALTGMCIALFWPRRN